MTAWVPEGGVLGFVAPLAMAASAGTALVIDLDPHGPRFGGDINLASLVASGPRRDDLVPSRAGVAVLGNGGVSTEEAAEVVDALAAGWPRVVLRAPPWPGRPARRGVVPIRALLPGDLRSSPDEPVVWQRGGWGVRPPGPGPVLPRPRSASVAALLEGRFPAPDRWVRAWREVWDAPWM